MKDSIFWKKSFIPVYFIVAFLLFLLFKFYIQTDNFSIYILIFIVLGFGIASVIYNSRNKYWKWQIKISSKKLNILDGCEVFMMKKILSIALISTILLSACSINIIQDDKNREDKDKKQTQESHNNKNHNQHTLRKRYLKFKLCLWKSFAGKEGFILKFILYFVYFFVSFFILNLLLDLVISILDFDVYPSLISTLFFAIFMTLFIYVLKGNKSKK